MGDKKAPLTDVNWYANVGCPPVGNATASAGKPDVPILEVIGMAAKLPATPGITLTSWASASICNATALSPVFALYNVALLFAALVAFEGRPLCRGATSASITAVVFIIYKADTKLHDVSSGKCEILNDNLSYNVSMISYLLRCLLRSDIAVDLQDWYSVGMLLSMTIEAGTGHRLQTSSHHG